MGEKLLGGGVNYDEKREGNKARRRWAQSLRPQLKPKSKYWFPTGIDPLNQYEFSKSIFR